MDDFIKQFKTLQERVSELEKKKIDSLSLLDLILTGALSVDTINEYTATHGVIVDGVLLKDNIVDASGGLKADTILEHTAASGVTIDGVLIKDNGIDLSASLLANTIGEHTSNSGVTIDSLLIKDGHCYPTRPYFVANLTSGTINAIADVIYNNEIVDNAGNYNPSTGIFTAPIAGLYVFGFNNLMPNANAGEFRLEFYKNNALYDSIIAQKAASVWQTIQGTVIVSLAVNDTMKIKYVAGGGALYTDGNYNRFWGALLV